MNTRAVVWVFLAVLVWPGVARADLDEMKRRLARSPDDVDLRLHVAIAHSRAGEYHDARAQALEVIRRAPTYWDAHLVVARLDAWDRKYEPALARVKRVCEQDPSSLPALRLWADIAVWSDEEGELREVIARLEKAGHAAEADFRRAQLAHREHDYRRAHIYASRALRADPDHERASQLRRDIRRTWATAVGTVEVWPGRPAGHVLGYGARVSVDLLPLWPWGLAVSYEYLHRFDTDNHRVGVHGHWRPAPRLSLSASVVGGKTYVVPELTLMVRAGYLARGRNFAAGLSYIFDEMPWPARLHRVVADAHWETSPRLHLDASAGVGWLVHCGRGHFVQMARVGPAWYPTARLRIFAAYAYGSEVDEPPLAAFFEDRYGGEVCPEDVPPDEQDLLDPPKQHSHAIGAGVLYEWTSRLLLRAGYDFVVWSGGGTLHSSHLALTYLY